MSSKRVESVDLGHETGARARERERIEASWDPKEKF